MEDSNLTASDRTIIAQNATRSQLGNTTNFATPQQSLTMTFSTPQNNNNFNNEINTQTVVKRPRTRQQTVTMESSSQMATEVDAVFSQVLNIPHMDNPIEELKRQMQKLFIQKESEWAFKLNESREKVSEELALCKIKLNSTQAIASQMDQFTKQLSANAPNFLSRQPSLNGLVGHGGESSNGMMSLNSAHNSNNNINGQLQQQITTDMMNELITERDTLRDEFAQLENSYSDLFKRYEKMRENCVLLKNSEDELKSTVEEDNVKYERLLARFHELREAAAHQLDQANLEIQRMTKQHEDNTLGLRCRLKMNDAQLQTLGKTIQGKDDEIKELKAMCEELMQKKGIMDDDEDEEDDDGEMDGE
ncbi:hypothetical protein niasHT_015544 [Heterodera trifolii]|uniref:Transforming acidic coiled-coil-containing protein C-terminal domain-containing protein n=1 Tax=Heterodera trifolii TaxID=157864 RepID=A0ABD2L061_9BILA